MKNLFLPSQDDLSRLSRWAIVAFAARCACRVRPLYQGANSELIEQAIGIAQELSAKAVPSPVRANNYAAQVGAVAKQLKEGPSAHVAWAACAAAAAAERASRAANGVPRADLNAAEQSASVVHYARRAAGFYGADTLVNAAIWRDFDILDAQRWTNDTPVPRGVFGVMWRDGKPTGWP